MLRTLESIQILHKINTECVGGKNQEQYRKNPEKIARQ